MICRNCGFQIMDGSVICNNCGCNQQMQPNDMYMQQMQQQMMYQQEMQYQQPMYVQPMYNQPMYAQPIYYDPFFKKKDSPLSLVSAIFGLIDFLFGFVAIIALIVGIIDLAINNRMQRHLGSWVGITFACIRVILFVFVFKSYYRWM